METPPEKRIKTSVDKLKSMLPQIKEITEISDNLMIEVLLKLPVKDILRLKCVAKEYIRMINDPYFGYVYFNQNLDMDSVAGVFLYCLQSPYHADNNFIFLNEDTLQAPRNPLLSLSFVDANTDIHRMSSCNGLICLYIIRYGVTSSYEYYVCNPTTNKSIRLPEFHRGSMSRILSMTIAFNPKKSPFYKVVCVWIGGNYYRFSIYCSDTRTWRDADTSLKVKADDSYLFTKGAFCFNSVHWLSESGPFLRFDMETECCETMGTTPLCKKKKMRMIKYFGVSEGCLYLMLEDERSTEIAIHCMSSENSEWALACMDDFGSLLELPGRRTTYSVHCLMRNVESGLFYILLSIPSWTFLVQLFESGTEDYFEVPRLLFKTENMHNFEWYHSHKYIMSLTAV